MIMRGLIPVRFRDGVTYSGQPDAYMWTPIDRHSVYVFVRVIHPAKGVPDTFKLREVKSSDIELAVDPVALL